MMTSLRLGLCATAISLCSCVVTTAPEPADFQLSPDALSHKYRAMRKTGSVRLYAQKIETTRDQWGRETHQASGGALLVKESHPPIFAEASRISVTPDYSEAAGLATVKKDDRLYVGQDDSATIRIDGTEIIPNGRVATRRVASETAAPPSPAAETAPAAALPTEQTPPDVASSLPQSQPSQEKPKTPAKRRPKPASSTKSSASSKPTPAPAPKTPAAAAKPAEPSPDKPKAPAANPNLLNLMREPTDR